MTRSRTPSGFRFRSCSEIRPRLRLCIGALLVLAVSLAAAPARADDQLSPGEIAEYKAHLAAGARKFQDQDFEGSRDELKQAYDIFPDPRITFSIAGTYRRQGRAKMALRTYRSFLSECESASCQVDNAEPISLAEKAIEELEAELAERKRARKKDELDRDEEPERHTSEDDGNDRGRDDYVGKSRRKWRWIGAGAAVLGAGGLVLAGIDQRRASGLESEIRDELRKNGMMWTTSLDHKEKRGKSLATQARIVGIAGGVLVLAGAGLVAYSYLSDDSAAARRDEGDAIDEVDEIDEIDEVSIAPVAGPRFTGLAVFGSF